MSDWVPYIVPVPAHFHGDDDEDERSSSNGSSVYTVEEMIYLEDSDDESEVLVDLEDESDSEIEEVNNEPGQWAHPIDLTLTSDEEEEGGTDSEYDDDSTDDEMYLE